MAEVPQLVIAEPPFKIIWPQLTVRVSVGLFPVQEPEPVAVSVAVKVPLLVDGVNVANAGLAF